MNENGNLLAGDVKSLIFFYVNKKVFKKTKIESCVEESKETCKNGEELYIF